MEYHFDWDPVKEQTNVRKHNVRFSQAATIFLDPNQVSTYDLDHSENEERWATIGMDSTGVIRVVIHTYQIIDDTEAHIRLISARSATRPEIKQYQEGL